MTFQVAMLNLSYLLIAVGLTVRDMLLLRSVILVSEGLIIYYGFAAGNYTIVLWNALFMAINAIRIAHLVIERRPLEIPEEYRDIYQSTFARMTSREFLYLWNTGRTKSVRDGYLCRQGAPQGEVLLILDGTVSIVKDKQEVARLVRGDFVAEMSFLTGDLASADAVAVGDTRCMVWSQEKLHHLADLDRNLLMKLQVAMGLDLTRKLRRKRGGLKRITGFLTRGGSILTSH